MDAHLGTVMLVAHRVALNALLLSLPLGIGFGIDGTTLVGQSIGAWRIQERTAAIKVATTWAVISMSVIAALLFIFAPQVLRLLTSEAVVMAEGVPGLRMLTLTQPFWAVVLVQAGALRDTGNTRFPLMITGCCMWASVPLAFALSETIGGRLVSIKPRL